jgi:malic enzyme
MDKRLDKIVAALGAADKSLSKVELRQLGTGANRSKLRQLLKDGTIVRNETIILVDTNVTDEKIEQAKLIKNDKKRETVINKIKHDATKEKFFYTYKLA